MDFLNGYVDPFRTAVDEEFASQPPTEPHLLREEDLDLLPEPVRRHVRASGAIGRPKPRNLRLLFEVEMFLAPGKPALPARSLQYNFVTRPARIFFLSARMRGLPIQALHLYREERATFQVQAARLVSMVDQSGPQLSAAETVTVLNDLCLFAPGALSDPRLSWTPLDEDSCEVRFTNGPHSVSATLRFTEGRLVHFWSDDRPDSSSGRMVPMRWNTPVWDYAQRDGLLLPTGGSAVYDRPDGPFEYGRFALRSIAYDVGPPRPTAPPPTAAGPRPTVPEAGR